jgi:hypothetical protein
VDLGGRERAPCAPVKTVGLLFAFVCLAAGCGGTGQAPADEGVTFSNQVVRLLQQHCQGCHRPDGHAPFPLITYDQAVPFTGPMKLAVANQVMPQGVSMRVDTGCGDLDTFDGPRRLSQDEIDMIVGWIDAGAPEGDPADLPPPIVFPDPGRWQSGEPDFVFANAERGFEVPGRLGHDVFRRFVIPTDFESDRFITGFEALPGTDSGDRLARVVHHVTLFVDPMAMSGEQERQFQESNPELPGPGFEGDFTYPTTLVGMWFPGSAPLAMQAGVGIRVPPGANLVMEVHYAPGQETVNDHTMAGVHLAESVAEELASSLVKNEDIFLPAGAEGVTVDAARTIDQPFTLHSITPHMHQLGTDFVVSIELPEAEATCLADVAWDFEHQGTYRLREPLELPAGTTIRTRCTYDNSHRNPNQFNDPPQDIEFGRVADLEMCQLTIATSLLAPPPPAGAGELLINEVLADPPSGYDAGGDGAYHYHDDEFVELVNIGDGALDLSGATLADEIGVRATLPAGTVLAPGEVLVVFGGGSPADIGPGVQVLAASSWLQLNNDGDTLTIRDAAASLLGEVSWGSEGGDDQSLVRATDGDPQAAWVLHGTLSTDPASPGRRADGSPF